MVLADFGRLLACPSAAHDVHAIRFSMAALRRKYGPDWQSFLKERVRSTLETGCSWFLDLSFAVLRRLLSAPG